MKTHTSNFKDEIKILGKQQSVRITYTLNNEQIILTDEDINSATPNYEASLLKSVMKVLELDSNVSIPKGTEIKFEYGLLVNGEYEYLDYGNYIVEKEPEKQEDTLSYKITCYDKMLYSMKDYEHIEVNYPCKIKKFLTELCKKIGLEFKDSTFANQDREFANELFMTINKDGTYSSMGYTYRDVLDQIAETTGGCICMTLDDKVEVRYINDTNDTIDEEYINDTNVSFGEKYGPINSIVLARASDSDRVYKKNQSSIDTNGLCEVKISENQFMNFNDRSDYLQELSDKLFGVEYYLNDFVSTGIMYYDLLDMYGVKIYGKTYNCLMLNDEQNITQGLEENIHTDRPETSETDYTKADKTDRKINQTNLLVDKQNQKIQALITQIGDRSHKETSITADIDGINSKVENIQDFTREKTQSENLFLSDIAEGEGYVLNFKVYGNTNLFNTKKITLCASSHVRGFGSDINLLTEDGQELLTEDGQSIIIGETSYVFKSITLTLDDYLRSFNDGKNTYYDTLEIAQDGTIKIIRRIKLDAKGNLYLLDEPEETTLEQKFVLPSQKQGTYYYIKELAGIQYYGNYIIQNDYSDTFLTKLELGTKIEQNAESVKIAWNQISEFIQMMVINGNASFAILDKDKKIMMALDKEGQHFYSDDGKTVFGEMGVHKQDNQQYISFSVNGEYENRIKNGMAWGITTKSDGKFHPIFYIRNFKMADKSSDASYGELVMASCNLVFDGISTGIQSGNVKMYGDIINNSILFINSDTNEQLLSISSSEIGVGYPSIEILDKIRFFKNQAGSNSLMVGSDENTYALLTDKGEVYASGKIHTEGNLDVVGHLYVLDGADFLNSNVDIAKNLYVSGETFVNGNVYANNISSDRRVKDNIKNSTTSALDIIQKIQHKEFDKKTDKKHYKIGYIAQELEQLDDNFVLYDKDNDMYYINELPIIATLSKAIQEQQEQIEELKEEIKKLKEEK